MLTKSRLTWVMLPWTSVFELGASPSFKAYSILVTGRLDRIAFPLSVRWRVAPCSPVFLDQNSSHSSSRPPAAASFLGRAAAAAFGFGVPLTGSRVTLARGAGPAAGS